MFVVDRFESACAVLSDDSGRVFTLPRSVLPLGVQEGDVVRLTAALDRRATAVRRRAARETMKGFFEE